MLNMTREEFMHIAVEAANERTKYYTEGKNKPELGLLFMLFGLDIARKITDEIYGEENNESQS